MSKTAILTSKPSLSVGLTKQKLKLKDKRINRSLFTKCTSNFLH